MAVRYHPLNRCNKEVRLLKLPPRARDKKRRLIPSCQIFHVCLPDNPQYVALSYVWGNQSDKRMILVEESPVQVTKNLYDAMMALQPGNKSLVIWIDSLCIDQTNDQEKGWQVELMKDIYRQTTRVFAWLGLADRDHDAVMDYLNAFGAQAEACGIDHVRGHHLEI